MDHRSKDTSDKRSVRLVPTFDGDHKKFHMWNTRFRAFATVCRMPETLTPKAMMPARENEMHDW